MLFQPESFAEVLELSDKLCVLFTEEQIAEELVLIGKDYGWQITDDTCKSINYLIF